MSSHQLQVRSSLEEMACLLRQGIACRLEKHAQTLTHKLAGQRTWPSLSWDVRDVKVYSSSFLFFFKNYGEGTHWSVRNQPLQHEAPGTCESQQVATHKHTTCSKKRAPSTSTHTRRIHSVSNDAHQGTQPKANGAWSNALLTCVLNCHGQ